MADAFDFDSVAAVIVSPDRRYLFQLRDDIPGVNYPGMWGLFGGAPEPGESFHDALLRELDEELGFVPASLEPFMVSIYDQREHQGLYWRRTYFLAPLAAGQEDRLVLSEGSALQLMGIDQVTRLSDHVVPFDLCAVLLHAAPP